MHVPVGPLKFPSLFPVAEQPKMRSRSAKIVRGGGGGGGSGIISAERSARRDKTNED